MTCKLTNEIVDKRLVNRTIIRIGNYENINSKLEFKCLVCEHYWKAIPNNVLKNDQPRGCPKCARKTPLTNEIIDERLTNKSIKRVGDYNGILHKMKWKCLIEDCNYDWIGTVSQILYNDTGCPKCGKCIKYTNNSVDEFLVNYTNIKRIDDIINSSTKINWQCLIDNHIWSTTPSAILKNQTGCPKCSNNARLSNEIVDKQLEGRDIKRLDDYVSANRKISWQCLKCQNIWVTTSAAILAEKSDCPACANSNEQIILRLLKDKNIDFKYQSPIKAFGETNKTYRVDFYIPKIKLAIEYNGIQHYEPTRFGGISIELAQIKFERQRNRDKYVKAFCKENNIMLIEIDGRKLIKSSLEKYINDVIYPLTTVNS